MRVLPIAAVLLLVAYVIGRLWRRGQGMPGAVTIRGGTVSIDQSEAIEERQVWEFVGKQAWDLTWQILAGTATADAFWAANDRSQYRLALRRGMVLDVVPLAPGTRSTAGAIDGQVVLVGDPSSLPWQTFFRPRVLTVQEQVAVAVVRVPSIFRPPTELA